MSTALAGLALPGGLDVDPDHDRELPSRPSTYILCLVVGLSALSHSPVPGASSIGCVRHSLASRPPPLKQRGERS